MRLTERWGAAVTDSLISQFGSGAVVRLFDILRSAEHARNYHNMILINLSY